MTAFQLILAIIIGIVISRGVFTFSEAVLLHRKRDKHLYFSIFALGAAIYIICELLLSFPEISETKALVFHRIKIVGLIVGLVGWMLTVYDIYFKKSVVPKIFMFIMLGILVTIPTPLFLSLPVRSVQVELGGILFHYQFAKAGIFYTLMSVTIGVFFVVISIGKFIFSQHPLRHKVLGICSFLPGFAVFNDFLVSHRIINNVMIAEYIQFLFIVSISFIFLKQNTRNHWKLIEKNREVKEYSEHLEDIVKQRTAQIEEEKKQKTMFFINFAHELKTPVTLIMNYFNEYLNSVEEDSRLNIINQNILKLKRDINNFLDVEKLQSGRMSYNHDSAVSITETLKSRLPLFVNTAGKKSITLSTEIAEEGFAKIDPFALDRIIDNLVMNAIKYTEHGGRITIRLAVLKNQVELTIRDTGIGISGEQLENIFKPYYQLNHKKRNIQGIGMGLYIVKSIIDDVGGKLTVESNEGAGSCFRVTLASELPVEELEAEYEESAGNPLNLMEYFDPCDSDFDQSRETILLVEDEKNLLALLLNAFKGRYNVFYALNGVQALDKLESIPKPDLIISDVMMDEMDGFEFHEKLGEEYSDIPFIFLTAKTTVDQKIRGLESGAIDYISKPFLIDELTSKVDSVINNRKLFKESSIKQLTEKVIQAMTSRVAVKQDPAANREDAVDKYGFTGREKDVFVMLLEGRENKEIAYDLNISLSTVKRHIFNIYQKAGVKNRLEFTNHFVNYSC